MSFRKFANFEVQSDVSRKSQEYVSAKTITLTALDYERHGQCV